MTGHRNRQKEEATRPLAGLPLNAITFQVPSLALHATRPEASSKSGQNARRRLGDASCKPANVYRNGDEPGKPTKDEDFVIPAY